MEAKSTPRETFFVPGTSRDREGGVTLRLAMARDRAQLLEMGERIRRLREEHGYKQQWIADQVGVALRTYQFWQSGKNPPEQESLEKLASLFGVTPKYILRGETPEPFSNGDGQLAEILEFLRRLDERLDAADDERQRARAEQKARAAAILRRIDRLEATIRDLMEPPQQQRA